MKDQAFTAAALIIVSPASPRTNQEILLLLARRIIFIPRCFAAKNKIDKSICVAAGPENDCANVAVKHLHGLKQLCSELLGVELSKEDVLAYLRDKVAEKPRPV